MDNDDDIRAELQETMAGKLSDQDLEIAAANIGLAPAVFKAMTLQQRGDWPGVYAALNAASEQQHLLFADPMATMYENVARQDPAFVDAQEDQLGVRMASHWKLALDNAFKEALVPLVSDKPHTPLKPMEAQERWAVFDNNGLYYTGRSLEGLRSLIGIVSRGWQEVPEPTCVDDLMHTLDFSLLTSSKNPHWRALRKEGKDPKKLTFKETYDTAVELFEFVDKKLLGRFDKMQQGMAKLNAKAKKKGSEQGFATEKQEALFAAREFVVYDALVQHLQPLRYADKGSRWGFFFSGTPRMQDVDSCFFEGGQPGPQFLAYGMYRYDDAIKLPALCFYGDSGVEGVLQNICFEATCDGKEALVVDGVLGDHGLAYHDHSSLTFKPQMELVLHKNLEGLLAMARELGKERLLVNVEHSDSHQSTHDFATYVALKLGMRNEAIIDGDIQPAGAFRYLPSVGGRVMRFSLEGDGDKEKEGFCYTHEIVKKRSSGSFPGFYNESLHPYAAHRGEELPFMTSGDGLIRALEIDVGTFTL